MGEWIDDLLTREIRAPTSKNVAVLGAIPNEPLAHLLARSLDPHCSLCSSATRRLLVRLLAPPPFSLLSTGDDVIFVSQSVLNHCVDCIVCLLISSF